MLLYSIPDKLFLFRSMDVNFVLEVAHSGIVPESCSMLCLFSHMHTPADSLSAMAIHSPDCLISSELSGSQSSQGQTMLGTLYLPFSALTFSAAYSAKGVHTQMVNML